MAIVLSQQLQEQHGETIRLRLPLPRLQVRLLELKQTVAIEPIRYRARGCLAFISPDPKSRGCALCLSTCSLVIVIKFKLIPVYLGTEPDLLHSNYTPILIMFPSLFLHLRTIFISSCSCKSPRRFLSLPNQSFPLGLIALLPRHTYTPSINSIFLLSTCDFPFKLSHTENVSRSSTEL